MDQGSESGSTRDLRRVLEITRGMVAAADLDALLGVIIDRSVELLDAERATVFLYDAAANELVSRVAHETGEIRLSADTGIAGAAARSRQVVLVADAYADERFNADFDRAGGFRTRNLLAVPLLGYSGELVGVLEVLNRRRGAFTGDDVFLAETLAAQAGVAVQRANLIAHYLVKQRMQRSLEIARQIQRDLLPKAPPRLAGFDVAGFTQPADETGGDFFDFFALGGDRLAVVVADVTGHGIGPALLMAETRAILRALAGRSAGPAEVLAAANRHLADDLREGRFVTCFFGVLDGRAGTLAYASAGHGPLLIHQGPGGRCRQETATGLPLGLFADGPPCGEVVCRLAGGDLVAVPTDGLYEAADGDGRLMGIERVIELLNVTGDAPAERVAADLLAAAEAHAAGTAQSDDISAVVIRRT